MDLYIQPNVSFEKTGAETELPQDPNQWPQQILQELYKQVPYVADFEPHVNMDKVDAERGYGFGHIEIGNKTEAPMDTPPEQEASAGIRKVRVPVVIKENKLLPFDLIVTDDSKMMPLTESRLRQAIFRPQQFDVTSETPGDKSMVGQLYPPFRQNYGYGSGSIKQGSVLESILPTINESDYLGFTDAISSKDMQVAYVKNAAATSDSLKLLLEHEPTSITKTGAALTGHLKPDVVQISRASEGYKIKSANHDFWQPVEEYSDRGDLIRRFGEKVALAVDLSGAVTLAEGATALEKTANEECAAPASAPGLYKVETMDGKELVGFIIPNLIDVTGESLPISLFTNGSASAVQTDIVGTPAGESNDIPVGETPTGYGAFVSVGPEGLRATVPLKIEASYSEGEEPATYTASTFDGRPTEISIQPNIQNVVGAEGKMLIPQHWRWMPLGESKSVALVDSEGASQKEASVQRAMASVEVRCSGNCFSVKGPSVTKLAHDQREFLNIDDTMFLLAGLGVDQEYATTKLGQSFNGSEPVRVKIGRTLTTADEQKTAASKRAQEILGALPALRRPLFKEAAFIPDPGAVDTVLSLGFLNPQNIMTFVSYLPNIEEAQQRLCELLLSARLGLQNISITSLEHAVRAVEEVLEGLKILAFQGN